MTLTPYHLRLSQSRKFDHRCSACGLTEAYSSRCSRCLRWTTLKDLITHGPTGAPCIGLLATSEAPVAGGHGPQERSWDDVA